MSYTLLALQLKKKDDRTEVEEAFLQQHKVLAIISEVLVEESKLHISSEEAVVKIRDYMNKYL